MKKPAAMTLVANWLCIAGSLSGCGVLDFGGGRTAAVVPPPDTSPAFACPWLDAERYQAPAQLPSSADAAPGLSPARFVPGCAIVRFTVAADGRVANAALRAANPLNDGPTALAALQQMRFQPARRPATQFVIRLSMRRDNLGHPLIATETRRHVIVFGDDS